MDTVTSSSQLTVRPSVGDALHRARLVRDGGAYEAILRRGDARSGNRPREGEEGTGPLAGVPFAVKDIIAVAGQPLRAGSATRSRAAPEPRDASVITLLRGAGAVPLGRTTLHELAFGVTGINAHAGTPRHPIDVERITGGSSSGSALAVAEGSAQFALGTDTGGSVRIPAALCGVVGLKPSLGTYPTDGVLPLSPTLDHVGVMAADVDTVRTVHAALVGEHARPRPPARVGVATCELEGSNDDVARSVRAALDQIEGAGSVLVPVRWPSGDEVFATSTAIMFAEAAHQHRAALEAHPELFGDDVAGRLRNGLTIGATTYISARQRQRSLRRRVERILEEVDCVIGPTVPITAPLREDAESPELAAQLVAHTRLANVVGLPAVSIPVPGAPLPVGVQVTTSTNVRALGAAAHVEAVMRG